jgi:IS1 family transposase
VQCDEVWSFCYAKERNVPVDKQETGAGSVWLWTAIDADTKLILSYLCGSRDGAHESEPANGPAALHTANERLLKEI